MRTTPRISAFVFAISASMVLPAIAEDGGSGDELETLRKQFEELRVDAYSGQERFDERYSEELRKLGEKAKAEAKLDLVLAVQDEAKGFRARGSAPAPPSSHPDLARFQEIYREQTVRLEEERNGRLATLLEGYRQRLEALQTELTREDEIEAALAVRKELKGIEEVTAALATKVAEPGAPERATPSVVTGRGIRIDLPGERRTLHLAEVEIFSGGENVALRGKAEQSSTGEGCLAEYAIDGNTEGDFTVANGNHTQFETSDPWIEVKLVRDIEISRFVIWNRTDGGLQTRLNGMKVTIFDKRKKPVWSRSYPEAPQTKLAVDFADPANHD